MIFLAINIQEHTSTGEFPIFSHGFPWIFYDSPIKKNSFFFSEFPWISHIFPWFFIDFPIRKHPSIVRFSFFPNTTGWTTWMETVELQSIPPSAQATWIVNIRKKRVVNDGKLTFIFLSEGLKSPTSISYSISYYISCPISCSINITNDG